MISFKITAIDDESGEEIAVLEDACPVTMPLNMTEESKAKWIELFLAAIGETLNNYLEQVES